MWLLGHTVFAYLLVKVIWIKKDKRLEPETIFFIFIFGNLIDGLHFGALRFWSHNLLGTILMAVVLILTLKRLDVKSPLNYSVLMLAALSHSIGDLLFSSYYPFFPFSRTGYSLYRWNGFEDLIAETLLSIVFFTILILSGDFMKIKGSFSKVESVTQILFVFFSLFALGQFIINLTINSNLLLNGVKYVWLFNLAFLSFLGVLYLILKD